MSIIVNNYNIINTDCLEATSNQFNIKGVKIKIEEYKIAVNNFCEEVTVSMCFGETFKAVFHTHHLTCETVEFIMKWQAHNCKLRDIIDLKQKIFGTNHNRVYITDISEGNAVIVTCYTPPHLINVLMVEADENREVMEKLNVIKLTVGYTTVWVSINCIQVKMFVASWLQQQNAFCNKTGYSSHALNNMSCHIGH